MKNKIQTQRPKDSEGQQPQWPGEKVIKPGTLIKDGKEKTIIPIVGSTGGQKK